VYCCLSCHADRNGQCWPSHETIAVEVGCHRRSVIRAIKKLENTRLVAVHKRLSGSTSNIYTLLLRPGDSRSLPTGDSQSLPTGGSRSLLTSDSQSPGTNSRSRSDSQSPQTATHSHPAGDSQAPEQYSGNKTQKKRPKSNTHSHSRESDSLLEDPGWPGPDGPELWRLQEAAKRIVRLYMKDVTAYHPSDFAAKVVCRRLKSGATVEQLERSIRGYAFSCKKKGITDRYRLSCAIFFGEGSEWEGHAKELAERN
jgi:hypothetical protein